jgi:hypothetical protein
MGSISCCCCATCQASIDEDDLVLRVALNEHKPRIKSGSTGLKAKELIFFSGARQGMSLTLVSRQGSLEKAREFSRSIKGFEFGATFICRAQDVIFFHDEYETCLDLCSPSNAAFGHIAVRIRNRTTGDIQLKGTPEDKTILSAIKKRIFDALDNDSNYI